jgi:hypothetical protein
MAGCRLWDRNVDKILTKKAEGRGQMAEGKKV